VLVRVRIAELAPLRGVRAFLALGKLQALGEVSAVSPAAEVLQGGEFGPDFALRLVTTADAAEIERAVRSAGDIDAVEIGGSGGVEAPAADPVNGAMPVEVPLRQQRNVRIDLRRLDALMNLIGELVITRGRLTQLAGGIANPALDEAVTQASRLISDLQTEIMTSRMVPVWQVFDRFPRLVRDAARSLGKEVEFEVVGKEIELDRSMLDEIGEPVVHLLRNAVDHGIELPEERRAAGKSPEGRVTLSALRDRSAVVIRVTDDGRGIDRRRVLARAKEQGLVEGARQELSDDELFRIVSRPGFSTANAVTDISGRGVGVDAVHNRVRSLGGSVEMRSVPGSGTIVTVRLPLTLAIVRALLARVGDERYAVPLTHVSETVELDRRALRTVKGREVLVLRDEVMPLLRLREVVRLPAADAANEQVVLLEAGERRAALVVDELTGQQEIVVKQYDAVRGGLASFSGATILGDGQPALILDVSSLL
jgi:two-component system chemotaxis sensor kinase CheA